VAPIPGRDCLCSAGVGSWHLRAYHLFENGGTGCPWFHDLAANTPRRKTVSSGGSSAGSANGPPDWRVRRSFPRSKPRILREFTKNPIGIPANSTRNAVTRTESSSAKRARVGAQDRFYPNNLACGLILTCTNDSWSRCCADALRGMSLPRASHHPKFPLALSS
jgi:hypothetical protein